MKSDRDRFWILDGHSLIYRAIFRPGAPLTSPTGEPTRGTLSFCKMLFALVNEHKPDFLAMAVDAPRASTFRRKAFPGYKVKRERTDEEELDTSVPVQLGRITSLVEELGIPVIGAEGFEGDDVVASLVDCCASDDVECVVVSRDRDLHQLVGPNCSMFDHQSSDWFNQNLVEKIWGVPVEQIVEVKTLMGDSGDCIPGVYDIGKKKAVALIQKFGTVANVMDNLESLPPAQQRHLMAADLDLCRLLVALRNDVPLPDLHAPDLEFNGFDMKRVRPSFQELGFQQWL
jgi:DNA polymerase-1